MTIEEHKLLAEADNEIALYGKTDIKCPCCGNSIIIEDMESSYRAR